MEKLKDRLGEAFRLYFILVTLISLLLMILGLLFDADRRLGYGAYLSPHLYAAIGVLPVLLFQSEKELSLKGLIIRRLVQLMLIEAAILLIVFKAPNIPSDRAEVVIGIAAGIPVIYVLSMAVEYIFALTQTQKLNLDLENYQRRKMPGSDAK